MQLWIEAQSVTGAAQPPACEWLVALLNGDAFAFVGGRPEPRHSAGSDTLPILLRHEVERRETWVLLGSLETRVNGSPLPLGIAVLRDRDEVRVGTTRAFFSTERLARVEPFPGAAEPIYCPRCKDVIAPGTDAVQCPAPGCALWHHQTEDLPCWTYSNKCALCDQPTPLDTGYRWTPEEL